MDESGQSPPSPGGFLDRLRRIGVTLLSTVQNRIELFGLELHEERNWAIATLIWAGATVFLAGCALLVVTITVAYLVSDAVRPYVLIGFCLLYGALAVGAGFGLRNRIHIKPPPFKDTVLELKKDISFVHQSDERHTGS
jgi:uncharacterized membrane protein YqjE